MLAAVREVRQPKVPRCLPSSHQSTAHRTLAHLTPGQRFFINDASSGVGAFAAQIAKAVGAQVTGVCSTRNLDLIRPIGADQVVDYTHGDFTRYGQRYDLILDHEGNHSLSDLRRALTPGGVVLPNAGGHSKGRWFGPVGHIATTWMLSMFVPQQGRPFLAVQNKADLATLKELIESGKVTPVIDRTYPLTKTVQALMHVRAGHARGKVIITVDSNGASQLPA